jgi:hypothetical protein
VVVTVNPPQGFTGFVGITQTIQFNASVTGNTNQSVTWAVNTVAGGNSTVGTVNASGLYTAPNQIPNPQKVTVTATSQADTTKSASTSVFISRIPPSGAWQRSGPPGGTITVLAEDVSNPGTIYAGTDNAGNGGLWKSTDGGGTWAPLVTNTVLDSGPAFDIAVPASGGGKVIYVCDDFGFSSDGGATWTTVATGTQTRAMAVDPQNRLVIYLSAPGKGVFKSQDAGATWTFLASSPVITNGSTTAALHNPLAVDATQSNTVYYGTDHGMFVSPDGGATWNPSTNGFAGSDTAVRDVAVKGSTVFALAGASASVAVSLYESTNHGTSWTILSSSLDGERIVPDPASSTTLYLYGLAAHAVYKSTDGGHTFNPSDSGMPGGGSSSTVTVTGPSGVLIPVTTGPNTFLATIGGLGVFRSQDAAGSWTLSTKGISAWFGEVVAFDPATPTTVYLGAGNGGGIWKSTDSGVTWANLRQDSAHAIAVDPFNSLHILAAAFDEGLIQSQDGSATWQKVTNLPPPPGGSAVVIGITFHPTQNGTIFISAQSGGVGVLKSTDGGNSWNFANSGLTTDQVISAVTVNPQNSSMLFLGTQNGVFKSTDFGNSWTLKTPIKTPIFSIDAKVSPLAIYINGAKSIDLGETWQAVANSGVMIVDPSTPNSIFRVDFTLGAPQALWSPDGGVTWFPFGSGFGKPNLFAGFGGGGITIAPSSPQVLLVASSTNSVLRFVVGP